MVAAHSRNLKLYQLKGYIALNIIKFIIQYINTK